MMLGILSFFVNPTSVLAPLAAAGIAFTLGAGLGFVKGYDAADTQNLRATIVSLEKDRKDLISAAEQKDAQLAAHELRVEEDRSTQEKFDAEVKAWMSHRPASCRIDAAELRKLNSAAAR
jgi:hypothetical protein